MLKRFPLYLPITNRKGGRQLRVKRSMPVTVSPASNPTRNNETMSADVKSATNEIKLAIAELKKRADESVKGFKGEVAETKKTFDVLDGYSQEVKSANAELRGLLAGGTNNPLEDDEVIEAKAKKGWLAK
jgi:hypothetical protein